MVELTGNIVNLLCCDIKMMLAPAEIGNRPISHTLFPAFPKKGSNITSHPCPADSAWLIVEPFSAYGSLNNSFVLFTPQGSSLVSDVVPNEDADFWHKVIPRASKNPSSALSDPTYYIVSREAVSRLQDHRYCADPEFFLVPARTHRSSPSFAGFISASLLLPRKHIIDTI